RRHSRRCCRRASAGLGIGVRRRNLRSGVARVSPAGQGDGAGAGVADDGAVSPLRIREALIAGWCYINHLRLRQDERPIMSHRQVLEPSAGHPITIEPTKGRVQVRVKGELVADTTAALELKEATLPVVQYIPLGDVAQDRLTRTDTSTYCPFKGDASY